MLNLIQYFLSYRASKTKKRQLFVTPLGSVPKIQCKLSFINPILFILDDILSLRLYRTAGPLSYIDAKRLYRMALIYFTI